jgi:hypothetical protein
MRLRDDNELENTRRKLAGLLDLIEKKVERGPRSPAHEWSLESMKEMARQLKAEIDEYERSHQTA